MIIFTLRVVDLLCSEGKHTGEFQLQTPYETVNIPFRYEGLLGSVAVSPSRMKYVLLLCNILRVNQI